MIADAAARAAQAFSLWGLVGLEAASP